jgi:hypothetical protein
VSTITWPSQDETEDAADRDAVQGELKIESIAS